jgi:hypothetical protein
MSNQEPVVGMFSRAGLSDLCAIVTLLSTAFIYCGLILFWTKTILLASHSIEMTQRELPFNLAHRCLRNPNKGPGVTECSTARLLTVFPCHDNLLENAYSIQIPTYSLRRHICARTLQFLANFSSQFLLDIFVIWIDRTYPSLIPNLSYYGLPWTRVPIYCLASGKRPTPNDRFLIPSILRTKTIISWDDDLIVTSSHVDKAFVSYLQQKLATHVFGPFGRSCQGDIYRFSSQNYSLILTNFAFLGVELLESYHRPEYKVAREEVAKLFNGEDILMNFITANVYHTKPILISIPTKGHSQRGISTLPRHAQTRSHLCGFFLSTFLHIRPLGNNGHER